MSYDKTNIDVLFRNACEADSVHNAKVVAGLVRGKNMFEMKSNSLKSHPFQKRFSTHEDAIFLHAEINVIWYAIKQYGEDVLTGLDLYVVRAKRKSPRKKDGYVFGNAKPCLGCQRAIATFGIRNVYYSTDDGSIECL